MGSKGGGGGALPAPPEWNEEIYLKNNPDVAKGWAGNPLEHYYMYGRNENRSYGQTPPFDPTAALAELMHGMRSGGHGAHGASSAEDAARRQGEAQRNAMYGAYLDAAEGATDFINAQVEAERSNAKLLGVEYNLSDQAKRARINDYFATIWGASDQRELTNLFNEYGAPEGFRGFSVVRGKGASPDAEKARQQSISTTEGIKRAPALTSDEDEELEKLNSAGILG